MVGNGHAQGHGDATRAGPDLEKGAKPYETKQGHAKAHASRRNGRCQNRYQGGRRPDRLPGGWYPLDSPQILGILREEIQTMAEVRTRRDTTSFAP